MNHNSTVESLRKATGGAVDDISLMTAANQYMNLSLPTGGMEEMWKAATTLGRAMGMDATQSINDFNTAVGRASPLILDNFGIALQASDAQRIYAEQIGKTAAELTEAEKKTAFQTVAIQKLMEKASALGDNTSAVGDAWAQFNATMTNFQASVGSALIPVLNDVLTVLNNIMPAVQGMIDAIRTGDWDSIRDTIQGAFDGVVAYIKNAFKEIDWGQVFIDLGTFVGDIPFMLARSLFGIGETLGKVIKETDWGTVFSGMWEGWSNFIGSFVLRVAQNLWEILPKGLRSLFGEGPGASGGIGGGGVPEMAGGGIVTKPTLAMIGEAGPEAVVPLSGGGGVGSSVTLNKLADTIMLDPAGMSIDELGEAFLNYVGDKMLLSNIKPRRI